MSIFQYASVKCLVLYVMNVPITSIWNEVVVSMLNWHGWIVLVIPMGAVWSGLPCVEQSAIEGVETDLVGDITIVVTCDGVCHCVIVVISVSQLSSSVTVLVLYLSSVNRGPDSSDKCDSEF